MVKVIMVVSQKGFQDEEFYDMKKIFESKWVLTFGASQLKVLAYGVAGKDLLPNMDISEIKVHEYDGIVFIGGEGASSFHNNPQILQLAKEFFSEKKIVSALDHAVPILLNAGLIDSVPDEDFFVNENIIIAKTPDQRQQLAEKISEILVGDKFEGLKKKYMHG